jgi:hypothetical protein
MQTMKRFVIAKKYPSLKCLGDVDLTIGKAYEILSIGWTRETYTGPIDGSFIPKEPEFFINIIDNKGKGLYTWNDYFFSTEELREIKLKLLLSVKE